MALVSQENAFVFPPSVLEAVLMGRSPYLKRFQLEGPRDLQMAEAAMEQTRISHLRGRSLNELSSGEKQRVFLARALCQKPRLLLLDEPTAFLDIKHQVAIMDLVMSLHRQNGLTILVASHDINLAAQYCRRLILIREGTIAEAGHPGQVVNEATIRKVFDTPVKVDQNPFTQTPRITLISGQAEHV
jgi:iron complex transport system ATP-binding protein